MRISDWSSDVCSSDLPQSTANTMRGSGHCAPSPSAKGNQRLGRLYWWLMGTVAPLRLVLSALCWRQHTSFRIAGTTPCEWTTADRKRVGEGKSVSVRVDLGGRGISKKKKRKNN